MVLWIRVGPEAPPRLARLPVPAGKAYLTSTVGGWEPEAPPRPSAAAVGGWEHRAAAPASRRCCCGVRQYPGNSPHRGFSATLRFTHQLLLMRRCRDAACGFHRFIRGPDQSQVLCSVGANCSTASALFPPSLSSCVPDRNSGLLQDATGCQNRERSLFPGKWWMTTKQEKDHTLSF